MMVVYGKLLKRPRMLVMDRDVLLAGSLDVRSYEFYRHLRFFRKPVVDLKHLENSFTPIRLEAVLLTVSPFRPIPL